MTVQPRHPVVVGVDGSAPSHAAIQHAAWQAGRRGVALELVCASPSANQEWSRHVLDCAYTVARAEGGELTVHQRAVTGRPDVALGEASSRASLVVVGTRARPGLSGHLAGSMAARIAAHSAAPVVVIRDGARATPTGFDGRPVTVGVDGSAASARALTFAVGEAEARGVPVKAVFVWGVPSVDKAGTAFEPPTDDPRDVFVAAERLLAEATAGWAQRRPDMRLIRCPLNELDVVEALSRESAEDGLVVVGSRGHGGFLDLRLGSTVDGLIRWSGVPVAVVRGSFDEPR